MLCALCIVQCVVWSVQVHIQLQVQLQVKNVLYSVQCAVCSVLPVTGSLNKISLCIFFIFFLILAFQKDKLPDRFGPNTIDPIGFHKDDVINKRKLMFKKKVASKLIRLYTNVP